MHDSNAWAMSCSCLRVGQRQVKSADGLFEAMLATCGAGLNCEPLVSYGVWSYKRLYMSCDIKEVLAE